MTSAPGTRPELLSALRSAVQARIPSTIADLGALVRIPSVAWDTFDHSTVDASASAVAALAESTGVFESVRIVRAPAGDASDAPLGQPAVLATRAARNGRPTVLLYAHHDVQPPGDPRLWDSPAYEPTVRDGRLYGRGAADDKAGVMAHIGAIRALLDVFGDTSEVADASDPSNSSDSSETAGAPDPADAIEVGIVLFIEGEEEFGSRSFPNLLAAHRDALKSEVIVVADSTNWDVDTPALTVGLRGNLTFELTVSTLDHASHSGMFGGAVPDAMLAIIRLLASFHAPDGSVAIEGLTGRDAPTPDYDEAQLRLETGLLDGVSPIGSGSILGRIWSKPAVTVTGIDAPSVAAASNTLAPTLSAKVSVRVAPGQSADDAWLAVERHIEAHTPFGAHVRVSSLDKGEPFLVDTSGWAVAEALTTMAEAWGVEPIEIGVGGSIPFISDLVRVFPGAEVLVTGVEDPDSRAHSPNESLHLGVFHRAMLAEALLLARLNERQIGAE